MGGVLVYQRDAAGTSDILESSSSVCVVSREREARELLSGKRYELILIHLEPDDCSGMDLAVFVRGIPGYSLTPIIFLAWDNRYEYRAFHEIHCYDYLLKPLGMTDFVKILYPYVQGNRFLSEEEELFCRIRGRTYRIRVEDILYVQCGNRGVDIHTVYGVLRVPYMNLAYFTEHFPRLMIQCHRSAAVNRTYVDKIDFRQNRIVLWRGERVGIGRKYMASVRDVFKNESAPLR